MKVKHDDHYELIVDGRIYYICIVCKRSYACLTSLRRHFNVHSWEKKYPCRYCDKVFALAEYRTKHELHHTGERRLKNYFPIFGPNLTGSIKVNKPLSSYSFPNARITPYTYLELVKTFTVLSRYNSQALTSIKFKVDQEAPVSTRKHTSSRSGPTLKVIKGSCVEQHSPDPFALGVEDTGDLQLVLVQLATLEDKTGKNGTYCEEMTVEENFSYPFNQFFVPILLAFEGLKFPLDTNQALLIGLVYTAFRDKVRLTWITAQTPTPETKDAAPPPDTVPQPTSEMSHPDWVGVLVKEMGQMLKEHMSPVVASLAPAGGKPCPQKGESDGASVEPTDITTIQVPAEPQGQSQPAAVAPVETEV
ncbi:hypothetical protein DUI87_02379 [Hirundo rustica rustica]|uniref:C2H2-type domain-containing protein n=1 Tax=Hirundo rustica rustica TaxID=333673 RepID=A0A3M0L841_HIRRU|nr:hypothetical protein DUI87_02379 [Hirundo rustica rustica]